MHNFFRPGRNGNSAGSEVTHRPMAAEINRCRLYAKLSRATRAPWVDRFLNNEIYCYPLSKKRCGPLDAIPLDDLAGGIVTSGRQQRNVRGLEYFVKLFFKSILKIWYISAGGEWVKQSCWPIYVRRWSLYWNRPQICLNTRNFQDSPV